jgi:hypothetical protein
MKRYYTLIAFLLLASLGIFIVRQYGESWDEQQFFKYADNAISSYSSWPRAGEIQLTGNTYDNYGPVFVIFVELGAKILQPLLQWSLSDLRHLLYYFTWLSGIWAFYTLAKRWMTQIPAIGATLLFATQPLFWGHAFISPKDIPFLTFFLLSLEFGFRLVDNLPDAPRAKKSLLVLTALWLVSVFGLFSATPIFHAWIDSLVRAAAAGQTNIVSFIAKDIHKVKPEIYVQKYFVYFLWARAFFFIVFTAFTIWMWRTVPNAFRFLFAILPAAILSGITTSIRVLGPFVGLMVAIYAFYKHGKKPVTVLIVYGIIALFAVYLTWPYLWLNPIGNFMESAHVMSQYPWKGQVLFNGADYASANLPISYLPVLLGIQLTEPVWILFALGLTAAALKFREKRELLALTLLWFILPLIGFIVTRPPLYDNFRQIFFILPPVFFIAGILFEKIKKPALQIALIALCVLPGIIDGARLHPYEYIYYNRFIGGEAGAFRKFESDYWGTSYREAAEWLNANAPANSAIWVEGPAHLLGPLRPDLKIFSSYEVERAKHYDFVVATTRYNLDQASYANAKIVYEITRDGAILTVIKKP